ncbi:Hemopexin/matrixin [Penicillium verrucosum]|uniref:Hemopexin/matrixin n=1 Tax=Penicillium verrucosum TaxID=60171 RepID=UPI002545A2B5|nr:Hemopexin/matrixin [Penicillium verrucosum]KAJ5942491.1 Hemopexin/matrixin [Penicillium verrucosum]
MVDAVIPKLGHPRQFYVFSGTRYTTVEIDSNYNVKTVGAESLIIREKWSETFGKVGWGAVDAMFSAPGYKNGFYAFVGGNYMQLDIDPDSQKDSTYYGTIKTEATWKGLMSAGFDTVDAAIQSPSDSDCLFFFRGTKSFKYSISGDKVVSGPNPITSYWPGIAAAGFDSIDAIFRSPNGDSYYVFKGDQYARIKWTGGWDSLEVDAHTIRGNWSTLGNWV